MAIEIVSFPIKHMVMFHSYVNVYQRVWFTTRLTIGFLDGISWNQLESVGWYSWGPTKGLPVPKRDVRVEAPGASWVHLSTSSLRGGRGCHF